MGEASRRGTFEQRKAMSQDKFLKGALEQEGGSVDILKAKIVAIYNKPGSKMYGAGFQRMDEKRYKKHAARLAERLGLDILEVLKEHKEKP